ncbi:MAG: dienelactone hydrolase family protein [Thalassobaculaceae bacterium]|nr:dienelactone hydrolase family protein [Thalassobaculaceae bacterium]
MSTVSISAADGGSFSAYVAQPSAKPAAAVVVIQEIFGVNAVMRDLTDAYAAQGYLAICPDLFWRIEPGIDITDKSEAEWQQAFDLFGKFDVDLGVLDLIATLNQVRGMDGCNGKAGTVGYCLGGKLAYLMATRSDADANVSFYGVGLDALIGEAAKIAKPYLCHVAENDGFVPKEAQDTFIPVLAANAHTTVQVYNGQDHAFARVGGEHYDKASADLANGRTADFFKAHLG